MNRSPVAASPFVPATLWRVLTVAALVLAFALPADAGKGGGKTASSSTSEAQPIVIEESCAVYEGGINPTNIPLLADDLYSVAASMDPVADLLGLPTAHQYATGRGVVVAVLDGGWTKAGKVQTRSTQGGFDAVDGDTNVLDYGNGLDDDKDGVADRAVGHGTFVAGMILKVAPGATILPIRAADDEGRAKEAWVIAGLEYAIRQRAHIVNMSIEMPKISDALRNTLGKAVQSGVFMVVSAGNGQLAEHLGELATSGLTMAVAGTDCGDCVAPFSRSDYDWWRNLVYAPGVDLVGPSGTPTPDSQVVWSGTSFSAGLATGAMSLAREVLGTTPSFMTLMTLRTTVAPVKLADGTLVQGTGRIAVGRFVQSLAGQMQMMGSYSTK